MNSLDPFVSHFVSPNTSDLERKICIVTSGQAETTHKKHGALGRLTRTNFDTNLKKRKYQEFVEDVQHLSLKQRLIEPAGKTLPNLSGLQSSLSPYLFNYEDILFCARTTSNAAQLRDVTTLHVLNHVFKTRDRIIKNNAKADELRLENEANEELRDQGFTRPKVLILLETRQQCVKYVDSLVKLSDPDQQENKKRFLQAFSTSDNKFGGGKPLEFRELFEGNDDNDFRIGLKFTRKTIKFYSRFYNSDIILASPLGLRRAVKADNPKKIDYDFLSSIEICVVDQADAMLMQNWEHVEFVLDHLNIQPRDSHGCDFSRVRQWCLDGKAKHLRQTVVFSAFLTPELNGLFNQHMNNTAGKVKTMPNYSGSMLDIDMPIRQTFCRYSCDSPAKDPDERFKYFTTVIVPSIARMPLPAEGGLGVLIFIPNYYDFVRIRNYFAGDQAAQELSFGAISEYAELAELQRARSYFLTGKHSVLLYTGRAHHFRRLLIHGVKRVFFYGLPENPIFYNEIVGGFLGTAIGEGKLHTNDAIAKALFSKWDGMALERIVGTERVKRLMKEGAGDTFDFR